MCAPSSVVAMDPVGMTKASATNIRRRRTSTTTIAIVSMPSRKLPWEEEETPAWLRAAMAV